MPDLQYVEQFEKSLKPYKREEAVKRLQQAYPNPPLEPVINSLLDYYSRPENIANSMLDFIPGIGDVKSAQEAITGNSLINKEELNWWERGLSALGALPLIPSMVGIAKGTKFDIIGPMGKKTKAVETLKPVGGIEHLVELSKTGGDDLYIRWSRGPEYDIKQQYSLNKSSKTREPGLSAIQIEPHWSSTEGGGGLWYFVKRLSEYSHGTRFQDPKVKGWIYRGKRTGIDSDGSPTIKIKETIGRIDTNLLKDIDGGLSEYLRLKSQIGYDEWRKNQFGQIHVQKDIDKAIEALKRYPIRFKKYDPLIDNEIQQKIKEYSDYLEIPKPSTPAGER